MTECGVGGGGQARFGSRRSQSEASSVISPLSKIRRAEREIVIYTTERHRTLSNEAGSRKPHTPNPTQSCST